MTRNDNPFTMLIMFDGQFLFPKSCLHNSLNFSGQYLVSQLPRLHHLVDYQSSDVIHFAGSCYLGDKGQQECWLQTEGSLHLLCQRCLEPLDWSFAEKSCFVLVGDENQLPDFNEESNDCDWIVVKNSLDILEVVQDEILLALPLAPKHDSLDCAVK